MPKQWKIGFSFCVYVFLSCALHAKERPWTHFGLRPLGMGNAFVAVSDDFNALFYNPAGLATLKEWDGELLNPSFEIAEKTLNALSTFMNMMQNTKDLKGIIESVKDQSGTIHRFALGLTPHLIFHNFGFGLGIDIYDSMKIHRDFKIELDIGAPNIVAPVAFAFSALEKKLHLGFALKLRAELGVDYIIGIETSNLIKGGASSQKLKNLLEGGIGLGADFGLLFTPIEVLEPTIGLSITDIGATPFTYSIAGLKTPTRVLPSVNTGFSFKPIKTPKNYVLIAMDVHSINQPMHYSHKLNFGAEWGLGSILKLQAGLKDGFYTAGCQFDAGLLSLRLASYVADHSTIAGATEFLIERRYAFQLKLLI